jgi:hypothetical protein
MRVPCSDLPDACAWPAIRELSVRTCAFVHDDRVQKLAYVDVDRFAIAQ